MKLKYCAILTVLNFALLQLEVITLFMPLVAAIQQLDAGAKPTGVIAPPSITHVMLHPAFGLLLLVLAIAALGASIHGAKKELGKRGWWMTLAVLNALALFGACMLAFAAPKFMLLYKDIGTK